MRKLEEHHDLYLKPDILLLDDMFNFRNGSLKSYGLCLNFFQQVNLNG